MKRRISDLTPGQKQLWLTMRPGRDYGPPPEPPHLAKRLGEGVMYALGIGGVLVILWLVAVGAKL